MRFGVALGRLAPAYHLDAAVEADRLGFESVWLPEHLVFPAQMSGSPHRGQEHPPVPPTTPVFDCFAYLSFLAGRTERVRLGSHVYLMGLRHPFVAARAIQTLDIVSGGRAEVGVGAGWLESECRAAGVEFVGRGRRLDEVLAVCKRLWTESEIAHDGEFFDFEPVVFEPKPEQRPWPPIHVGGESEAALSRAARTGDGWIGLAHTLESVAAPIARLHELAQRYGRGDRPPTITVMASPRSAAEIEGWEKAGVDRIIVAPWRRSREAVKALREFADEYL